MLACRALVKAVPACAKRACLPACVPARLHSRRAAEQAVHVAGQAEAEVRKLQASICQLDRQLGWQAASQQLFNPLDVHGAVAWQPAGKPRTAPAAGSPARGRSPSPARGSPMNRVSRRIMEAQSAGGGGAFLERLSRDVAARQAKGAEAARRAGRYRGSAQDQLAEREREARDAAFLRSGCGRCLPGPHACL